MFTSEERRALRDNLVARARSDEHVIGAALVGSAAAGSEDDWSDIDLALQLGLDAELSAVVQAWTDVMYADHGAVHHLDVWRGETLYRVFLFANSLQVDLSFWSADDFRATTPSFRLLFGEAAPPRIDPAPSVEHLAGMGWLYALHVRSALARGRLWQAVHMLDGMRDQVVGLACARHGLPAHQGRGVDQLPGGFLQGLCETRAKDVELDELHRAFVATTRLLLAEIAQAAPELAARLAGPMKELVARPENQP
ncbi:MAG TPA: nucleotidyltransferase domain-containing protein [Actinopolymorphaceae bacterium]|jgi:predicted nucleotidyltransferase